MLRTQADLMPRVREYLASLKETMEANDKVQANFDETFFFFLRICFGSSSDLFAVQAPR